MHGLAFGLLSFFSRLLFLSFLFFFDFLSLDLLAAGDGLLLRGAGAAVSPCLIFKWTLFTPFAVALCKEPAGFSDFLPLLELLDGFLELLREDGLDELLERLDLNEDRPLELALRDRDDCDSRLRERGRALES